MWFLDYVKGLLYNICIMFIATYTLYAIGQTFMVEGSSHPSSPFHPIHPMILIAWSFKGHLMIDSVPVDSSFQHLLPLHHDKHISLCSEQSKVA